MSTEALPPKHLQVPLYRDTPGGTTNVSFHIPRWGDDRKREIWKINRNSTYHDPAALAKRVYEGQHRMQRAYIEHQLGEFKLVLEKHPTFDDQGAINYLEAGRAWYAELDKEIT